MNGTRERRISRDCRTKGSISSSRHSSRGRRRLKRSMLRELKKLDSRRLRIRRELWQKSREKELRFSERCTKPERMSKSRRAKEISLRITPILGQQSMPQLPEMVFLLIRRQTSTRCSQRLSVPTRELRSCLALSLTASSSRRSAFKSSISSLTVNFRGVRYLTCSS